MIDIAELTKQLRTMKVRSLLYKTIKRELKAQGHWKDLPRYKGNTANFGGKIKKDGKPKILQR